VTPPLRQARVVDEQVQRQIAAQKLLAERRHGAKSEQVERPKFHDRLGKSCAIRPAPGASFLPSTGGNTRAPIRQARARDPADAGIGTGDERNFLPLTDAGESRAMDRC